MPAVGVPGAHGRADAHAFSKTDAGAVTITDARADARTDDGDARAHTTTVRGPDARALVTTDDGRALLKTDASALLVGSLLERQAYGSYRLWCFIRCASAARGALGPVLERIRGTSPVET